MPRTKLHSIPSNATLLPLKKAAEALGEGYSESSIRRRIKEDEWQEGIHYVDDRRRGAKIPRYLINIDAVRDRQRIPSFARD